MKVFIVGCLAFCCGLIVSSDDFRDYFNNRGYFVEEAPCFSSKTAAELYAKFIRDGELDEANFMKQIWIGAQISKNTKVAIRNRGSEAVHVELVDGSHRLDDCWCSAGVIAKELPARRELALDGVLRSGPRAAALGVVAALVLIITGIWSFFRDRRDRLASQKEEE